MKDKNNTFIKITFFVVGILIASLVYNLIFVKYNIVTGGVSGLAIVFKKLFGINTTIFIDVGNAILIIISFIFLGKKDTYKQLMGCILYPVMITLTAPLASNINIVLNSKIMLFLIAAFFYGLGTGLAYRAGYSAGGFDILTQIFSNKLKKPITTISPIIATSVLVSGALVFKPEQIMTSIIIILIANRVTNSVLFSTSTSKMVYVISQKNKDIENYIMNGIHTGATEIKVHSGLFEKKKQMLMCIIHNTQYSNFKHTILKMDPKAFILANKCYEVTGGSRFSVLPF